MHTTHTQTSKHRKPARHSTRHAARVAAFGALTFLAMVAAGPVTDSGSSTAAELNERQLIETRLEKFDLSKKDLALSGYDPVAYFPEGGGKATKGKKNLEHTHLGIRYRFATQQNLDRFKADPDKYEPAFGGWCAYAMAHEDYTEPNPKRFTITDGRLLLFYDAWGTNTYKLWNEEGPEILEPKANAYWRTEVEKEARKQAEG